MKPENILDLTDRTAIASTLSNQNELTDGNSQLAVNTVAGLAVKSCKDRHQTSLKYELRKSTIPYNLRSRVSSLKQRTRLASSELAGPGKINNHSQSTQSKNKPGTEPGVYLPEGRMGICRRRINTKDNQFIDVDLNNTTSSYLLQDVAGDTTYYKTLIVSIKDLAFMSFEGNFRNEHVFNKIPDKDLRKTLYFRIKNSNDDVCFHQCPSPKWQFNFLRCLREGMLSFFDTKGLDQAVCLLTGKTAREDKGDKAHYPTCEQFAYYIGMDITNCEALRNTKCELCLIDSTDEIDNFSIVALQIKGVIIHYFIYIDHGVCIEKNGTDAIIFQTVDQVIRMYQDKYGADNSRLYTVTRYSERNTDLLA